jgi:protoporphyrinogen/coproporphyrinogen III oxidase
MTRRFDLAVVGGGITGLAAAWEAHRLGADVVLLEAGPLVGGKLRTSDFEGLPIEESADAFLARLPDAVELCHELGLGSDLVSPRTGRAFVWADGTLRPLPTEQLLGVPTDLDAVAASGILSPEGLARARRDLAAEPDPDEGRRDAGRRPGNGTPGSPATGGEHGDEGRRDAGRPGEDTSASPTTTAGEGGDEAVGALVRRRLGDEVLDRLVAPLVGGIWAGDCDRLSLETATPTLAEARRRNASLIRGAAAIRNRGYAPGADPTAEGEARQGPPTGVDAGAGLAGPAGLGTRGLPADVGRSPGPDAGGAAGLGPGAGHRPDPHPEAGPGGQPLGPAAGGRDRPAPVFLAPRGGMSRLVEALRVALGDRVRTGVPVDRLHRVGGHDGGGHWRLEPVGVEADAVVVATPAFSAASLVAPHCGPAADALGAVEHASIVLVTLAVPRDGIDNALDGSGFLVPPTEGRLLTTCSWLSSKWEHLEGDGSVALLRASAGRDGDTRAMDLDDDTLVRRLGDDLGETMGLRVEPTAVRVNRWADSFPQPRPGHLARVAALETTLSREAPGLAVAGAWARGLGIPACIRSGRRAAADLLKMRSSGPG